MTRRTPHPRSRRALVTLAIAAGLTLLSAGPGSAVTPDQVTVSTFASSITGARGVVFDASGRLYVSQRYATSRIIQFANPGISNAFTVYATGIVDPTDMVFDDGGNLFVADYDNAGAAGRIWKVPPGGGSKTAFATIANPASLTRDAAGNLYAGEYFNQRIDTITPAGVVSTYVASIGASGVRLTELSMDSDGTLYAGTGDGTIYKVGPGGSPVTTFNTGMATVVGLTRGFGGDWYATSYDGDEIFEITSAGSRTLLAGAHATAGLVNGKGSDARFHLPAGIAFDASKNVAFVADYSNSAVREIDFPTPVDRSTWGRLKALYRH